MVQQLQLLLVMLVLWVWSPLHAQATGVLSPDANPKMIACDYRTSVCLRDEFMAGGYTTGIVGELGWTIVNGTATGIAAESNRPGIVRRDTGSTINTAASMYPRGLSSVGTINPSQRFEETWHIKLGQAVGTFDFRAGLGNATTGDPPADGVYFEVLAADTNLFCVTRAASVSTGSRLDSGVAAGTGWVALKIIRTASAVQFFVNDALVCSSTTNVPTAMLQPYIILKNTEAVAKTVDIDLFDFRGWAAR